MRSGLVARIEALGPFEPAATVAVGVSGGSDSMALLLAADAWARGRSGRAIALTVDHGLRAGAAAEAARVAGWCARRGIPHHVLQWTDPPLRATQDTARAARHRLLEDWCAAEGVLHLLLGHQRDDQAETLLGRLARGSGVDGLAAIPAVNERTHARLLRPFLDVSRDALRAFLENEGQDWVEDPSNDDTRHGRVRLRRLLAAEGLDAARLADTAARMGRARAALEADTDDLLARAVQVFPEGWALIDVGQCGAARDEVMLRALAGTVRCIGGQGHGPRLDRLERAAATLGARDGTLHGCRLIRWGRKHVMIVREPKRAESLALPLVSAAASWDGRFRIAAARGGDRVGPLGVEGWREIARSVTTDLPHPVRLALPALFSGDAVAAVPHLGYSLGPGGLTAVFAPRRTMTTAGFALPRRAVPLSRNDV